MEMPRSVSSNRSDLSSEATAPSGQNAPYLDVVALKGEHEKVFEGVRPEFEANASRSYTGIDSHTDLKHVGLYDTVVAL